MQQRVLLFRKRPLHKPTLRQRLQTHRAQEARTAHRGSTAALVLKDLLALARAQREVVCHSSRARAPGRRAREPKRSVLTALQGQRTATVIGTVKCAARFGGAKPRSLAAANPTPQRSQPTVAVSTRIGCGQNRI